MDKHRSNIRLKSSHFQCKIDLIDGNVLQLMSPIQKASIYSGHEVTEDIQICTLCPTTRTIQLLVASCVN